MHFESNKPEPGRMQRRARVAAVRGALPMLKLGRGGEFDACPTALWFDRGGLRSNLSSKVPQQL